MKATLAIVGLLLVPFALATHEEGCVPDQYVYGIFLDTTDHGGAHYAMIEFYQPSGWGIWIYEESNGLEGLQRGDEVVVSETCGHAPDTIIF